jgi:Bax protein
MPRDVAMKPSDSQPSPRSRCARLLQRRAGLLVPVLAVALWSVAVGISVRPGPGTEPLPAFHEIEQVDERKQEFFDYLTPVIRAENERIRQQRTRLMEIAGSYDQGQPPGWQDRRFLAGLAEQYRLEADELSTRQLLDALLMRVDVIPRSLVLVQAAKESGWGSSRFARRANNLFGQWCYDQGCGLVPQNRLPGRTHEVRSFDTVQDAVVSYLRNLNTHPSYEDLRDVRARLRAQDAPLSGVSLAEGLLRYSERGEVYVREVQAMIRQNHLEDAGTGS